MSASTIAPTGTPAPSPTLSTGETKRAGTDLGRVGREFEAILVRQMLASARVGGGSGGYGDMAIEALADAVTLGGGLGLGRAIEQALSAHMHPQISAGPLEIHTRASVPIDAE